MLTHTKVDAKLAAHEPFTEGPFEARLSSDRNYTIYYRGEARIYVDRYATGWHPMLFRSGEVPSTLLKMWARVIRSCNPWIQERVADEYSNLRDRVQKILG